MSNLFTTKRINVPGVLSDDALQEQLKQFGDNAKRTNEAAPAPNAAFDFADKIAKDYLDQPTPKLPQQSPAAPGAAPAAPKQGGSLGEAAARAVLAPWWMPFAERAGTLSGEEQLAEQQERVTDAKQREAALGATGRIREQLRNMPDAEAEAMGLPTAPGGEPEIAPGTPEARDPMVPAVEAAKDVAAAEKTKPTQTWWLNALQTGIRSAHQSGTGALRGAMLWSEYLLPNGLDKVPEYARYAVEAVDKELTKVLPGDPARSKDFVTDLSAGAGSMTAFLMAGYIGRAMAAPTSVAVGVPGALLGANEAYTDAEQFGATEVQKFLSLMWGTGLGATEALPIDHMFMRADAATGGGIRKLLRNTAATSLEEFVQEAGQALGQDIVAKYLVGYDEDREFDIKEYAKNGLVGAITGGAAGAATTVLGVEPAELPPAAVDEATSQLAQQAIDQLDNELNVTVLPTIEVTDEDFDFPVAPPLEIDGQIVPPAPPIETPEFQTWFGDSKVRDEQGVPMVVYHGTDADEFTQFRPSTVGTFGSGVYAADAAAADVYGGRSMPLYMSLKNPWVIAVDPDSPGAFAEDFDHPAVESILALPGGRELLDEAKSDTGLFNERLTAVLREQGYDGVVATYPDGSKEYVAFDPTQIKSVNNSGAFDPNNPDILAQRAPDRPAPMSSAEYLRRANAPMTPARGGSVPANAQGKVVLTHWSSGQLSSIDPEKQGTGPYRGQERKRLVRGDPDFVARAYYGVNAAEDVDFKDFAKAYEEATGEKVKRGDMTAMFEAKRRGGYIKEAGLGRNRYDVSVDADRLYNWYEDPLKLRDQLDRTTPMPEQVTRYERLIRDAGFDGVFFSSSPLGQTAMMFTEEVPDGADFEAMTSPERQLELADQIPGLKGILKYLTPEERGRVKAANAQKIVDIFEKMPNPEEMAAVAVSGRAKRGWYASSAKALVDVFGAEDAPRFAALLAALSPQVPVESNAVNALNVWVAWDRAGRPKERNRILNIMAFNVQGGGTTESILPAWIDNTIRALTTPDATQIRLSGPKVNSFMKNLQGVTVEVTNDAWMANYANIDQSLFRASYVKVEGAKIGEKGVGYMAMSAAVRAAADAATNITGQQWTPAEIQETVWSWAKTVYERMDSAVELRGAAELLRAGGITDADIASTPDFATLFTRGIFRTILERGGYGERLAQGSDGADGPAGGDRNVFDAEGTGFAPSAFERHLLTAARRLEERHERHRGTDEDLIFPGDLPAGSGTTYDILDTFDAMIVGDQRLEPLPGLPDSSPGPVASVVRAAQAYAASAGIPFRRQAEYVKVDPDRGRRIAQAYQDMEHRPQDPFVASAYRAMVDETLAQFQFVKASGLDIDFIQPGQDNPYPQGSKQVFDDLQRGHLWVFPADQGFGTLTEADANHMLLEVTDEYVKGRRLNVTDVFRAVHDFFGHGLEGAGFGARGEENAWQAHMRLYTSAALPAVTSETRGQNSWVNYGPYGEQNRANPRETIYADQKTGIMPSWTWTEGVGEDSEVLEPMFAGTSAAMANDERTAALDTAINMEDDGADPTDIWRATGFFRGVDSGWRFEISDADAKLTPEAIGNFVSGEAWGVKLHKILNHPKLYAAYPWARQLDVGLQRGQYHGVYRSDTNSITVSAPTEGELVSVLLHEVQHAIQADEGFDRGGNTNMGELYDGPRVETWRQAAANREPHQHTPEWDRYFRDGLRYAAAFEYYHRIAGEVEARNVQKRYEVFLEATDRVAAGEQLEPIEMPIPSATEDVPRDQQIITMRTQTPLAPGMIAEAMAAAPPPARPDAMAAKGTATQRNTYKAEPTRPGVGVADTGQAAKPGDEDLSLSKISKGFVTLLDLTARQGRLTLKGSNVMGQYSRRSSVVRLKTWNDLSTLVHEGGHALNDSKSKALASFMNANEKLLMDVGTHLYGGDLSTAPRDQHMREGFAEFFRIYTLNRAYADKKYPTLVSEFDAVLDKDAPALRKGLEIVGQQFAAWLQLPSAQMMKNTIVPARQETGINAVIQEMRQVGFRDWYAEFARRSVAESVNRYASLNAVVNQMLNVGEGNQGKAIDLKRADDPRSLIRLARNSGSRAMVQLTDGVMAYRSVQPSSRSLRDALVISQGGKPGDNLRSIDENRMQDFDTYLVALRALDEYRRFDEGLIERPPVLASRGDVMQTIADLEKTYKTAFADAAAIVHEYGMALWKKQYEAGLMSKETYRDGLERRFYAPLQRDMSDRRASLGASALTGGQSIVKRFRGSDRDIVSPLSVLMHKTFALEAIIAQNDVMRQLAQLSDRVGKAGALVERIPATTLMPKTFSVQEVARQLSRDENLSDTDANDLLTILGASIENENTINLFRPKQASAAGDNVLFFWENGKLAALQLKDGDVGADLVNLINGIGRENLQLGTELIAMTTTAFRTAITSWPDFLIVNYIRDQLSAWIINDVGFKPFVTGMKGMGDELRQNRWSKMYNASAGIMGGMNVATLHEARVNRDINALKSKGYLARAFSGSGFGGAVQGMARVVELSETGTRLGIFQKAYERAKKDGLSDWEAAVEAGYTATDYIDFGLNGSRMLHARRLIPFLNAQLQGLYKMMRTLGADEVRQRKGLQFALKAMLKDSRGMDLSRVERQAVTTGRKAWVKMASLGLISAALHFLFEDDPDYQEAGEYLRTTGWVVPMGDGRLFYIPKPFELALIANAVERGIESATGDGEAKARFMRGLALTMIPPTSPPAIQAVVEQVANRDFFTGREIVPTYMQALDPMLQFDSYTSELAKRVNAITGWSPMIVDHYLSSLGASAYRDIVTMTNALDPARPSMDETDAPILRRFVRDTRRGSTSAQDFWRQISVTNGKLSTAATTYKRLFEAGNTLAANRYLDGLDEDEKAYALLDTHFKAEVKRLNPYYRGRQITTIVSAMRRELVSELGLENTLAGDDPIKLTAREKAEVDETLSEYARREVRNTLVATGASGWQGKKRLPVDSTFELLQSIEPRAAAELKRRLDKAKVYDDDFVFDNWPEAADRLRADREQAFLKDLVSIAKATRQ